MKLRYRIFSLLITISILATPLTAYADDVYDPNASQGEDTGGIQTGTFDTYYTGFRVTMLNGNKLMWEENSCVDILFSTPPADNNINEIMYKNILGVSAKRKVKSIPNIPDIKDMPYPILYDAASDSFIANGKAVRNYLMDGITQSGEVAGGAGGDLGFNGPKPPSIPEPPSTKPLSPDEMNICFQLAEPFEKDIANYAVKELNRILNVIALIDRSKNPNCAYPTSIANFSQNLDVLCNTADKMLSKKVSSEMHEFIMVIIGEKATFSLFQYRYEYARYEKIKAEYDKQPSTSNSSVKNVKLEVPISNAGYNEQPLNKSIENVKYTTPINNAEEVYTDGSGSKIQPFLEACFLEYHPNMKEEIAKAERRKFIIETIVWYRPVSADKKLVADYSIYGTCRDIARHNIKFAREYQNDYGGGMELISNRALPNSMQTEKIDEELRIVPPDKPKTFYTSQEILGIK